MPGMYALRSASSSSSTAKPNVPSRSRHGAIPPPSVPTPMPAASRAASAFHLAASPRVVNNAAASMGQPILSRQVRDLSTEAVMVRARLHDTSGLNYSSSGSPHDPSTVCLAAMVHEFLEEEVRMASCGRARCNCVDGVCGEDEQVCVMLDEPEESRNLADEHLCEILEGITSCTSNPELLLLVDVARAAEAETEEMAAGEDDSYGIAAGDSLRRSVMKRLRQEGYNAAICKSRWKHGDGLPAGDYEYIDIVMDGKVGSKKQDRFIVDIDFKAQFEIARASSQYAQLLDVLPKLFVGRAERLKQILKIMSNAAKCSLKEQGLLLPPWRKHKYLHAKWFSSYKRTTNTELPSPSHNLLGLGGRAPKILSLDFTKEMDLLYYKAQMRGLNNMQGHYQHFGQKKELANVASSNIGVVRTGFVLDSSEDLSLRLNACTTAMCTDWQLPALDEKCKGSRDKVSGISTALRQASSLSNQPTSRLAMVS